MCVKLRIMNIFGEPFNTLILKFPLVLKSTLKRFIRFEQILQQNVYNYRMNLPKDITWNSLIINLMYRMP